MNKAQVLRNATMADVGFLSNLRRSDARQEQSLVIHLRTVALDGVDDRRVDLRQRSIQVLADQVFYTLRPEYLAAATHHLPAITR